MTKYFLRAAALLYLLFLLVLPVGLIGWRTFQHGLSPVWEALSSPEAVHAFAVTLSVAIWAVIANTVFGIGTALLLVRGRFPGRRVLGALIDLPLAVSPVVVGLALILVYGRFEPVGGWLERHGLQIIFSLPGMVLATIFVSAAAGRPGDRAGAGGDRRRPGAGRAHPGRRPVADLPAHHRAGHPLGPGVRRGAVPGPRAR